MIATDKLFDIDFERDGKQYGVIKSGSGPTLLLSAGVHGDEYEGQVVLRKLMFEIEPKMIQGRIIILPALNYPAVLKGTRTSPVDNQNLNRCFPGRGDGSPTEAIAHFVSTQLLPISDVGVDLHSGGTTSAFVPSTYLCISANKDLLEENINLVRAFNAPFTLVVDGNSVSTGFDPAAHSMNIPFISTELHGGGGVDISATRIGYDGVTNILKYMGIFPDSCSEDSDTIFLDYINEFEYLSSTISGIFEPCYELGSYVKAGSTAGKIYSIEEFDRKPVAVVFNKPGILAAQRKPAQVKRGSHLCLVVTEINQKDIEFSRFPSMMD